MSDATPVNYTTKVPVMRTLPEIHELLVKHGAMSVLTDYADGKPRGLSFRIEGPHGVRSYALPVDVAAMGRLLVAAGRRNARVDARPEQAERVAWRVTKDWLAAQLSLVDAQMAAFDQVMLPYMLSDDGRTIYARYVEHEQAAIER